MSSSQEEIWGVYNPPDHGDGHPLLVVDVDGFEGPLDLLLTLARDQKVDITRISILALAEQYLAFVEKIRELRLELAADYLVMAAWLAFLKSRLLLPEIEDGEEPSGEQLAAELAFRLRRLEAMRTAAAGLANRDRLGREVFARGQPEPVRINRRNEYSATLYDLLSAYAEQRQYNSISVVHVRAREVFSLGDARLALSRIAGRSMDWAPMDDILAPYFTSPTMRRSVKASALGASLELVREGQLELRQTAPFAPIYVRGVAPDSVDSQEAENG